MEDFNGITIRDLTKILAEDQIVISEEDPSDEEECEDDFVANL